MGDLERVDEAQEEVHTCLLVALAQLEALQQLGCDLGQGYFFSGPVEANQLGDLLAASLIDGRRFLFQQGGSGLG